MDLKNFFTPGPKIFTRPVGLRKHFSPQVEKYFTLSPTHLKKYLQVHVDLENFCHPQVEKYLQVHVDLETFFATQFEKYLQVHVDLETFVNPRSKNI